jgi:hypothetical protein
MAQLFIVCYKTQIIRLLKTFNITGQLSHVNETSVYSRPNNIPNLTSQLYMTYITTFLKKLQVAFWRQLSSGILHHVVS